MPLYLVTQAPKPRYRHAMVAGHVIIEAKTAAEAIRLAYANYPDYIVIGAADSCKPTAKPPTLPCAFYA